MCTLRLLFLSAFFTTNGCFILFAQPGEKMAPEAITIKGVITDSESGTPLEYANIGIPGKNLGTLSDPDGTFEIAIPSNEDTLAFSMVGYETVVMPVNDLTSSKGIVRVNLKRTHTLLAPVTIKSKRLSKRTARLGWMGGKDGVLPLDTVMGGGAVALLVEAPSVPVHLEKLQVRLLYNSKDTLQFRFHIFEFDSLTQKPGRELLTQDIMLKETKRFGWLRFNLERESITIGQKKFFIGFEWIDTRETRAAMLEGLRDWELWKAEQFKRGNKKVEFISTGLDQKKDGHYKYHGNMMDWPGFNALPPFTGLMVESGKHPETEKLRTFERKTSFGSWTEIPSTLNAVIQINY